MLVIASQLSNRSTARSIAAVQSHLLQLDYLKCDTDHLLIATSWHRCNTSGNFTYQFLNNKSPHSVERGNPFGDGRRCRKGTFDDCTPDRCRTDGGRPPAEQLAAHGLLERHDLAHPCRDHQSWYAHSGPVDNRGAALDQHRARTIAYQYLRGPEHGRSAGLPPTGHRGTANAGAASARAARTSGPRFRPAAGVLTPARHEQESNQCNRTR